MTRYSPPTCSTRRTLWEELCVAPAAPSGSNAQAARTAGNCRPHCGPVCTIPKRGDCRPHCGLCGRVVASLAISCGMGHRSVFCRSPRRVGREGARQTEQLLYPAPPARSNSCGWINSYTACIVFRKVFFFFLMFLRFVLNPAENHQT